MLKKLFFVIFNTGFINAMEPEGLTYLNLKERFFAQNQREKKCEAINHISKNDQVREVLQIIYGYQAHEYNPTFNELAPKIELAIETKKQIEFYVSFLSFKNFCKTVCPYDGPGLEEALTIERMKQFLEDIKNIYPQGATLTIFSDGAFYGETFGFKREIAENYAKEIKELFREISGDAIILNTEIGVEIAEMNVSEEELKSFRESNPEKITPIVTFNRNHDFSFNIFHLYEMAEIFKKTQFSNKIEKEYKKQKKHNPAQSMFKLHYMNENGNLMHLLPETDATLNREHINQWIIKYTEISELLSAQFRERAKIQGGIKLTVHIGTKVNFSEKIPVNWLGSDTTAPHCVTVLRGEKLSFEPLGKTKITATQNITLPNNRVAPLYLK